LEKVQLGTDRESSRIVPSRPFSFPFHSSLGGAVLCCVNLNLRVRAAPVVGPHHELARAGNLGEGGKCSRSTRCDVISSVLLFQKMTAREGHSKGSPPKKMS
jgi:hypothetical protein